MILRITVQFNKDYPHTDNCHSFHCLEVDEVKFEEIFTKNRHYTWKEITKLNYELAKYIMQNDTAVCRYVENIQYIRFGEIVPDKFEF